MRTPAKRCPAATALIFGLLLAAAGWSQPPPEGATIIESTANGALALLPTVQWDQALLEVSGPEGARAEWRLEGGAAIGFHGVDAAGSPLPDGRYRYQVRLYRFAELPESDEPPSTTSPSSMVGVGVRAGSFFLQGGVVHGRDAATSQRLRGGDAGTDTTAPRPTAERPARDPAAAPSTPQGGTDILVGDGNIIGNLCVGDDCPSGGIAPDDLVIDDGFASLRFDDAGEAFWEIEAFFDLDFIDVGTGTTPMTIEETSPSSTLHLANNGFVGIGTSNPDSSTGVFLGAEIDTDAPALILTDATDGEEWSVVANNAFFAIRNEPISDTFQIAAGAPAQALLITTTGVAVNTDFSAASSREIKGDIEPAATGDLLADLVALDVYTWKFKDDPSGSLHVGPMAEDFHQRFGLGRDAKHISPSDTAGLALAAIQALHGVVEERNAKIERLESTVLELRQELAGIQRQLAAQREAESERTASRPAPAETRAARGSM